MSNQIFGKLQNILNNFQYVIVLLRKLEVTRLCYNLKWEFYFFQFLRDMKDLTNLSLADNKMKDSGIITIFPYS